MPLAIDTIEQKLHSGVYPDVTAIESDVRRMIQNAKDYNEPGSAVFANAERIRKLTHNFMKQHNPAYKSRDYVARPTPLPDETPAPATKIRLRTGPGSAVPTPTPAPAAAKEKGLRAVSTPVPPPPPAKSESSPPKPEASPTQPYEPYETSYSGKTFQQAQEQILNEMAHHREEGE